VTARRSFGQSLRRQRELRGVSLEAIAAATKVSASLLAGLERGDCSRWPGGIYSRAYVRDYAKAIGLEPSEVAARFAEYYSETAHPDGLSQDAAPARRDADPRQPPLRLTLAPEDRGEALLRCARVFVIDLALVLAAAVTVTAFLGRGFWIAIAGAGLICHAIAILRGALPAASVLVAPFRGSASTHPQENEPHSESVTAEAT
jgi:transcriptional regulator with XRE-family HTH domain